jgi:beta-lactamase regulating signal transducer with metallopeptidase domain
MIAILAAAFVKVTVLLVVAAGTALSLRRSSAALRHLVWALSCAGVLALPVASAVLPEWGLAVSPRLAPASFAFDAEQVVEAARAPTVETAAPVTAPAAATSVTSASVSGPVAAPPVDWRALLLPIWLGGALLVMAALALGLARIAWLGKVAEPVRDVEWLALVRELSRGLGLARPVRLLRAAGPAMPMTWGVRRPVVLLPADADEWPVERRRDVLLHELAHVKRQDFLTQLIARTACAIYWFHPLVWLAAARLRVERERACDDHVLRAGTKPSAYANHLLEIARALRPAPATSLASVAMARPAQLATRLLDVLDSGRRRDVVSPRLAAPAWLAAIAVVLPLAAAAPRIERAVADEPIPVYTTSTTPDDFGGAADSLRGCGTEKRRGVSSSHRVDNDVQTIMATVGGCTVTLDADGDFAFTEDFTDIASVDGQLTISVDYGATDKRVTFRPAGNGVERIYKVDGAVRPFDAEARTWLAETLTFLLRRTGHAADERARWVLEKRGVQGLLDEIALLGGDYARRRYYQVALESGKLDVAGYERLIEDAGRTVSSDYELAELLLAVARIQPLTDRMQAGFVAAAKTLNSDYERRRVLQAALARPGLTPGVQTGMLDAAAGINSDYELATLLIELNGARRIDDAVRPAFFKAANSLQSDYEHRRVLSAVVAGAKGSASRAMLADVLESAKTISSDYELAQLLTEVGRSYLLDETLRPAFFAAAATLNSDYEHGRTLIGVVGRDDVSPAVAAAVVESSRGIGSDHQLAEVLIAVIRNVRVDEALRAAIQSAAEGISSSYDRGRVLDALSRRGRAELE